MLLFERRPAIAVDKRVLDLLSSVRSQMPQDAKATSDVMKSLFFVVVAANVVPRVLDDFRQAPLSSVRSQMPQDAKATGDGMKACFG